MSQTTPVRVVVFDLGGVIFTEGVSVATEKLFKDHGYDRKTVHELLKSKKSYDLRAGLIDDEEFWSFVQQVAPQGYDAHIIKECWYDSYVLDEGIMNLIKKLSGTYTLVAFSGNIKSRVEYLDAKYGFRKYFDCEVYSFDYHLNKFQEEFIRVLVEQSGHDPSEIVYIDDREDVLEPARKMGIQCAVYTTGEVQALKKALQSFGVSL